MENPSQMPSTDALLKANFTDVQWLQYYKNVWTRNAVARAIDVQNDRNILAVKPDAEVIEEDHMGVQRGTTIKQRLEYRKLALKDALDIVKAIETLSAIAPENFAKEVFSDEALAPAVDEIKAVEVTPEPTPAESTEKKDEPTDGTLSSEAKV